MYSFFYIYNDRLSIGFIVNLLVRLEENQENIKNNYIEIFNKNI